MALEARENLHGCVRERIGRIWTKSMMLDELPDAAEVAIASSDPDVFCWLDGHRSGMEASLCKQDLGDLCP